MKRPKFSAFVFVYQGRYLKFGSYSSARLVDNPLGASLYVSVKQASMKFDQMQKRGVWMMGDHADYAIPMERVREVELHSIVVEAQTAKIDELETALAAPAKEIPCKRRKFDKPETGC